MSLLLKRTAKALLATTVGQKLVRSVEAISLIASVTVGYTVKYLTKSDSLSISESQSFNIGKAISDALSVTDDLDGQATAQDDQEMQFFKSLSESPSLADTYVAEVGKNLSESPSITDSDVFEFGKTLSESPSITDAYASEYGMAKTDSSLISELALKLTGKNLSESPSLTDSGSFRGQGYCDFTYFADDYVGFSGTFQQECKMINEGLKLKGKVGIVLKDKDGKVKDTREINNLIVNAGLAFITSRMTDATDSVMSHMALGSGTTAASASDTDLGSILGSREALDSTTDSANTITYVASFEAGDATGAVTEAGIFNASTGGTMLCRTVFSVVNKQADDTMTVTWTITLTAS